MRYIVVNGSQSYHCCFEATVVDTARPVMIGDEQYMDEYESVCECFSVEDAGVICKALNNMEQSQ